MRTERLRLADLGSVKHLETNSIANGRSTDEIEFYLPKNNAVLFCSQNSGTNLNCEISILKTVYMGISVTGVCT